MQLEEGQNITKNGYVDYDAIIQKNAELTEENKRANVKIESLIIEINNQKHIIIRIPKYSVGGPWECLGPPGSRWDPGALRRCAPAA